MQRAIELAKLGAGHVAPNPMVGAVLVHDGVIIGEGYHMQYGQAHAEVNCINSVPQNLKSQISNLKFKKLCKKDFQDVSPSFLSIQN